MYLATASIYTPIVVVELPPKEVGFLGNPSMTPL
jgi:hypothetical protein